MNENKNILYKNKELILATNDFFYKYRKNIKTSSGYVDSNISDEDMINFKVNEKILTYLNKLNNNQIFIINSLRYLGESPGLADSASEQFLMLYNPPVENDIEIAKSQIADDTCLYTNFNRAIKLLSDYIYK